MKNNKIMQSFIIFLKAIAMGAADVVPGVSGGTVAIITGIYERLINAIAAFNLTMLKLLLKGRWKEVFSRIDWAFLIPLLVGIAVSILSLAKMVSFLLTSYPILVWAFFNGLLISACVLLLKQHASRRWLPWFGFSAALLFALWLSMQSQLNLEFNSVNLFIAGFIAISALILPGISGSFILLLLGLYQPVLNAIKDHDFFSLWPFMAGMVCGVLVMAHILKWLLNRYEQITLLTLCGFIVGSLLKIWPWQQTQDHIQQWLTPWQYTVESGEGHYFLAATVCAVLGFVIVQMLALVTKSTEQEKIS